MRGGGRLRRLALFVLLASVIACSATGEELTFSFFGTFRDNELWRQICESFEAANPDTHIRRLWCVGDFAQKLHLQMITDTAADMMQMDDEIFPTYSVRGYLEDLGPYAARRSDPIECELDDEIRRGTHEGGIFLPTSLEAFNYDDFQGGLPWCGNVVLLFYSKDLFDAAGIPYPDAHFTTDDFRRVAKELTRDTDGDGRMDQYGASFVFGLLSIEHFFWAFGGEILTPDLKHCLMGEPRSLEALQFLYDMKYVDHSVAWNGETEGFAADVQLLTGRLGMVTVASHFIPFLNQAKEGNRWGVAPMPIGPHGDRYTRATWDGVSVNAHISPEKKEIAWKFLKHVIGKESQALMGQVQRGLPIRRAQAETNYAGSREGGERLALEASAYSKLTPVTPRYLEMRDVLTQELDKLNVAEHTGATPAEVVKVLVPRVDDVLKKEITAFDNVAAGKPERGTAGKALRTALLIILGLIIVLAFVPAVRRSFLAEFDRLRRSRTSRRTRVQALEGVMFALPWFIGFSVFTAFPVAFSILLSFSEWDPYTPIAQMRYVGLDNFFRAFSSNPITGDPLMLKSLYNTFYYAGIAVPLGLCVSLGLAILLNQKVRGITIFRTVFYFPSIVAGVATVILWMYILNPTTGPINTILRSVNDVLVTIDAPTFLRLPEPQWLSDPAWSKPALILMSLWGAGGAGMLVFLAGLQGVPDQLYEAAELDGAGRLRQFWNITLPMLTPTIYFNLIMGVIGAMKVFLQAYVITDGTGGQSKALLFYVLHLYNKAFVELQMGYASALAWILFMIILLFTLLLIRSSSSWVYYEGERRR